MSFRPGRTRYRTGGRGGLLGGLLFGRTRRRRGCGIFGCITSVVIIGMVLLFILALVALGAIS